MIRLRVLIVLLLGNLFAISTAQTVEDDLLLLDLVAQQSMELHMKDTLVVGDSVMVLCDTIWKHYPHPLCIPLMYVAEPLRSVSDTMPEELYTIAAIRRNALRYIRANQPSAALAKVAKTAKEFLVVELNKGQMVDDVKISIECSRPVSFYGRTGGMMPTPEEILEELRKIGGRI